MGLYGQRAVRLYSCAQEIDKPNSVPDPKIGWRSFL
jgi:hypothetical protein